MWRENSNNSKIIKVGSYLLTVYTGAVSDRHNGMPVSWHVFSCLFCIFFRIFFLCLFFMSYFHIFLGRHNGTRTASIKYNLNEAISSARISSLSCASPFNNLISLSYSMLVFSANLLGLFQQILMCNNILRTCRNFLELKYLEKIFEKKYVASFCHV